MLSRFCVSRFVAESFGGLPDTPVSILCRLAKILMLLPTFALLYSIAFSVRTSAQQDGGQAPSVE
jgi:hypothetical protein